MKKKVQKAFLVEFFFDGESENANIVIKLPNGAIVATFNNIDDVSVWFSENLLTQEEYNMATSDEKSGD